MIKCFTALSPCEQRQIAGGSRLTHIVKILIRKLFEPTFEPIPVPLDVF